MHKTSLLLILLLAIAPAVEGQDGQAGVAAPTNMRNAAYPRILPDNRVVFRVNAPDAHSVQIDLGRKYALAKNADGVWEGTTEPQTGGFHYYTLLIDGVALADPASETFYGMSRMASGIEIPYPGRDYYALNDVPHGDIRMKRYFSGNAGAWRRFFIYTPPGYDSSGSQRYPVLYLIHGGGEDERGWATQGDTDLILDNLIARHQALPMLVVMVDGNGSTSAFEESYLKHFETEVKQEVIPFVEKNYRVKSGNANRGLAGLSLGGIETLYAGLNNTKTFGYVGVFSSGWILPNQQALADAQYARMRELKSVLGRNLKLLWVADGGKEDIAYNNGQIMLRKFDELGIKYTYYTSPGGHTWPVWRDDLYRFAPLLFR